MESKTSGEIVGELLTTAALKTIGWGFDALDSFTLMIPEDAPERSRADEACLALGAFAEGPFDHISGSSRSKRDNDREPFLPGQHKGVSLLMVTSSGETGRVNIYGGLRDPRAQIDFNDTSPLRETHAGRTERVASQTTQINFHLLDRAGVKQLDTWVTAKTKGELQLTRLEFEGEQINAHTCIGQDHYAFRDLRTRLFDITTELTTLISSV